MKRGDSTMDIMLERARLLARCDAQRDDLAVLIHQLDGPIKIADRGIAGVNYLRDHPLLLGGLVAALALLRRRGLWKWAQRGFIAWRGYRALRASGFKRVI